LTDDDLAQFGPNARVRISELSQRLQVAAATRRRIIPIKIITHGSLQNSVAWFKNVFFPIVLASGTANAA
jgi:hypothetical protein